MSVERVVPTSLSALGGRRLALRAFGAIMSTMRRMFLLGALALFALLAFSWVTPTGADAAPMWKDLPTSVLDTYGLTQDDIGTMSNGYPDGTWRPFDNVTRGQFVRLALGYFFLGPSYLTQQHFSDVPRSSPHYTWVEKAFEIGLVSGYQERSSIERTVFGLYDPITREQAAAVLTRYLSKMEPSRFHSSSYTAERSGELIAPFVDKDQVRLIQEVAMALDIGVLQPAGATLRPQTNLTRIQAAALIVRTRSLLLPSEPPPTDEPPETDWHVLWWLISDAHMFDIQVDGMQLGAAAPWLPRTLSIEGRVEAGQDPSVYQETAELLVSLAEEYKDLMEYQQVRVVLKAPGGTWVYDHTFVEPTTLVVYPPVNSEPYFDFFSEFAGEGYHGFKMRALHEGGTWVIQVTVRVDADKETRATYDAIYDQAITSAKQHGVATGQNERLRIVLVEATPIPPTGEPELMVLEQRDFDLGSDGGGE